MPSFLSLHALAAKRGDGLRPDLLALLERAATAPSGEVTRADGMVQSGPDPVSGRPPPSSAAVGHPAVAPVPAPELHPNGVCVEFDIQGAGGQAR
jgi:hypothetical protein